MHQVYVDREACKGTEDCGLCLWCCPTTVFDASAELNSRGGTPPVVARLADCVGCENCMLYCPDLAIVVVKATRQAVGGTP